MKTTFNSVHKNRKDFASVNKNKDHVILEGKNNILLSAPHGVSQLRLGKLKFKEIGSLATALYLKNHSNCHLIAKTKNNGDDANFDETSSYKSDLGKIIKDKNIKYVLDIHGLAAKRECDINLGTHLGQNIKTDEKAFDVLLKNLTKINFKVSVDQPFMGGGNTISGFAANKFGVWSLQIEINCEITNKKENFPKFQKLLETILDWICYVEQK